MIAPAIGVVPELALAAIPDDERVWVPQAKDVWFRPLLLNTVTGGWCNLLRVRRSGVLHRHRHPMAVVGYVIKGRWRYLEHDWVAEEGSFVYEPPGEIHTLGRTGRLRRDDHLLQYRRRDDLSGRKRPPDRLRGRVQQARDVPRALRSRGARCSVRRAVRALSTAANCIRARRRP